jgi:hypothetical protein
MKSKPISKRPCPVCGSRHADELHRMAFILVPDASRFAEFMVSPFQDINIEHINHFSADTLNKLFEPESLLRAITY